MFTILLLSYSSLPKLVKMLSECSFCPHAISKLCRDPVILTTLAERAAAACDRSSCRQHVTETNSVSGQLGYKQAMSPKKNMDSVSIESKFGETHLGVGTSPRV